MATNYENAQAFATKLAADQTKMELPKFFSKVQKQYYLDIDADFMKYYVSIVKQQNKFVVEHPKLHEYGIISSTKNVGDKLTQLGLIEDKDYIADKKLYLLTPLSFKKCLLRAQRNAKQTVDPTIFADYYFGLDQILTVFHEYQMQYTGKLIAEMEIKPKAPAKAKKVKKESNGPTYFAATLSVDLKTNARQVKFIFGDDDHIQKTIAKHEKEGRPVMFKLLCEVEEAEVKETLLTIFKEHKDTIIKEVNDKRREEDAEVNKELKKEIAAHNKVEGNDKRTYTEEKQNTPKLKVGEFPVKMTKTMLSYEDNEYMNWNEVIELIKNIDGLVEVDDSK